MKMPLAPLAAVFLLLAWVLLMAAQAQTLTFSSLLYVVANFIVFTDALDFFIRLFMHHHQAVIAADPAVAPLQRRMSIDITLTLPPTGSALPLRPFAIIASVFNLEPELEQFMEALQPYRERVWLISDGSSDRTVLRLRQAGWRCFDDGINRQKPGAVRRLLTTLPPEIDTVMVIDPDIRIRSLADGSDADLERVVADFQASGAAAACPRITIEEDGFLGRFQAFEYALAFGLGRRSLGDFSITSGVSIYRRDALASALQRHSLSVYAEDLENAVILLAAGGRIYYDGRLCVSTAGPGTWRRWFSQRAGWYFGLIKVYAERFHEIRRVGMRGLFPAYHYIVYLGVLCLGLHLLKIASAVLLLVSLIGGAGYALDFDWLPHTGVANPVYAAAAVANYLALDVVMLYTIVPRRERAYLAPILPLYLPYALVHLLPMTVGYLNWFVLHFWGRRVYHDHYEPRLSPPDGSP
jgi:cellulose synthase/poly-beta-1,6-N-acetylglucosamine synthase-like glycosyltransferase